MTYDYTPSADRGWDILTAYRSRWQPNPSEESLTATERVTLEAHGWKRRRCHGRHGMKQLWVNKRGLP